MNTLIIVNSVWLLLLALLLLAFRREVGVTLYQLDNVVSLSARDGLPLGSLQPKLRIPAVPRNITLLFLDPKCSPCHTMLEHAGFAMDPSQIFLVINETADVTLTNKLLDAVPPGVLTYCGTDSGALRDAFKVHSEPYAITIADGIISEKRYVRSKDDILDICNNRAGMYARSS